jgi:hypothetical protein
MFNILYYVIEYNKNNRHAVTTVAYVIKVTLNKFAALKPILREKKKMTNMRIVHLFKNNKYENFTPFQIG